MRITTTYRKVGPFYIACIGDFASSTTLNSWREASLLDITFRPKLLCLPGPQLLETGATRLYAGL